MPKKGLPTGPRGVKLKPTREYEAKIETRSGIAVRSQYERACADLLHASGVAFQYEPLMLLGGRQYRPDFYLPEHGLFVEICGFVHMPHYQDRVAQKRELYEKAGLRAVFVVARSPSDAVGGLRTTLARFGIALNK